MPKWHSMFLMPRTYSLAGALLIVLAACGSQGDQPQVGAAMIVPVRPATTPSGTVPPATIAPAPTPTHSRRVGSIYQPGWHGYDASYPQCNSGRKPMAANFSIVGVNEGRVFTTNRCMGSMWRAGQTPRALYLNSGYNPQNYGKGTSDCRALSQRLDTSTALRGAYAMGCSATVYSLRAVEAARVGPPSMWWIDVEVSNTWEMDNLNLNRFALQGEIDQLVATRKPVGVYSSARDWTTITGNWAPGVDANWVAGKTIATACAGPGFSGDPVWLVQEASGWPQPSGYDSDWAC